MRAIVLTASVLLSALAVAHDAHDEAVSDRAETAPAVRVAALDAGVVTATSAAAVDRLLTSAGLVVDEVREGGAPVPRLFVAAMPDDIGEIGPAGERKRIFIKLMLPLVLDANEHILADRARLLHLGALVERGRGLDAGQRRWLDGLATLHRVGAGDLDELVRRVDAIPVSLALAQAALESGWGTSRFAHEGNAVFGQHSWNDDDGIVPAARPAGKTHVVKSFDGLNDSVLAYLVNLNRHPAYEPLRERRAALRAEGRPLDGWTLAGGLHGYAEEPGYVEIVRTVIRQNGLTDFDDARLADLAI